MLGMSHTLLSMLSQPKAPALLAIGALAGVAIWLFSPLLIGTAEPWDADAPIWFFSWILMAVLGGLVGHVRGVCLPLGYALGQMLVTIQSVFTGEFGALGWLFIAGYSAVASLATLALTGATALFKRRWHIHDSKVL